MPRAVGVAQDQLARRAYAFEDGLDERAVGAAVRVGFAQPVHALPVLFLQGCLFAPYELVVAAHAAGMEGFEHLAAVERAAAGDRHRHGVGQCGVERTLVDVDADARDRPREGRARIAVFDEDADQFFVADIDVVRPFDAGVDAEGGEGVRKRQRDGFGEQELFADGQEHGFEHQREGEVLAFGARPRMPPLPAPGGLPFGPDDVTVAVFRPLGVVVGRGGCLLYTSPSPRDCS